LQQSIPILLGANIGTTVTTLTASLKLNLYAKRAAVAHFLFNLIGALIFLPIIIPFARLIEILGGAPANQVANAHTIFNIVVALLFIFWLKVFSRLIEKIIPGKEEEILFKTKYINEKVPKKINDALLLIEKEMKYSLEITKKMFKKSYLLLKEHSPKEHDKLKRLESLDDLLDQSIESFLMDIAKKELSSKESKKILLLVRISNAIEQLGDLADDLGSLPQKLEDEGIKIPKDSKLGINELYKKFETLLQKTVLKFPQPLSKQEFNKELSNEFSLLQEEYYFHMQRAMKRKSITGSIFVESASIIESSLTKLGEIIELTEEYEKVR
jgi:phosphate:Na+ symporter